MKVAEKTYLAELEKLKEEAEAIPDTRMMALAKVSVLVLLNMRCERIMMDPDLPRHPYDLVSDLVADARSILSAWREIAFIEEARPVLRREALGDEEFHRKLFQELWTKFSPSDYEERARRTVRRLELNRLGREFFHGLRCVDLGCGHGNFVHAMHRLGAEYVYGVDFGAESIRYASEARDRFGIPCEKMEFKVESVYRISKPDAFFDFAVQNGVFHHLENEDAAYREVHRVLKTGGWFWIYTDGAGAVTMDLWKASVRILRNVPQELILSHLDYLNIAPGKRYHLGDGLHAAYRQTTWEELTARLERYGFGEFRRLKGGFPTDFDPEAIAHDRYGAEKFGEGDLRVLVRKIGGADSR